MRVVPGSHLQPILPHKETWAENNLLTRGQEIEADVREDEIVDVATAVYKAKQLENFPNNALEEMLGEVEIVLR